MSKFKIITVSKDKDFKLNSEYSSLENLKIVQISDNTEPLTKIYNRYLAETRTNKDADFIIFMHADVDLNLTHMLNHIEECKGKYDVMGLCGTSVTNVSQSPLNWWTSSNLNPEAKWGCVTHGELKNQMSFFSQHSPNITDHEVSCIDGLCIIFGPNAINSEMKFDEQFNFDFYDTDISFQTFITYKLKLGVIIEHSLQHYSVGRSILTEKFLRSEIIFRNKWKLPVPENSPIKKLNLN